MQQWLVETPRWRPKCQDFSPEPMTSAKQKLDRRRHSAKADACSIPGKAELCGNVVDVLSELMKWLFYLMGDFGQYALLEFLGVTKATALDPTCSREQREKETALPPRIARHRRHRKWGRHLIHRVSCCVLYCPTQSACPCPTA